MAAAVCRDTRRSATGDWCGHTKGRLDVLSDRELRKLAREFRRGLLGQRSAHMMCFAISAGLQAYLSAWGVETELVSADFKDGNHVWLRLADNRILDASADQFGLPAIYLGPLPLAYRTRKIRLKDA